MSPKILYAVGLICCCVACGRRSSPTSGQDSAPAPVQAASTNPSTAPRSVASDPAQLVEPTRLAELPISAYRVWLTSDEAAVYLMTSNAAYRLVPGKPPAGIELPLGIGPALTQSAFVYWNDGAIWSAPKQGGDVRRIAKLPHQPQFFVASGDAFAWIDLSDEGLYSIQTLDGGKPRVLVTSKGELSALTMKGDAIYYVQRPTDDSWRIGVVRINGQEPEYGPEKKGRRPSMLAGSDSIYYYDVDKSEIRKLLAGVGQEEVQLANFVCSPIQVSSRIFCGCVEGLFEVSKETRQPRVLSHGRPGAITTIASNAQMVAWTVDIGADKLAVDMLPFQTNEQSKEKKH